MAELADALRSGRSEGSLMWVQVPPSAPQHKVLLEKQWEKDSLKGEFFVAYSSLSGHLSRSILSECPKYAKVDSQNTSFESIFGEGWVGLAVV